MPLHSSYVLAAVVLACMACNLVHSEVVLVYNLNRHGARNVLPKTAQLTESDAAGGPTLLPKGQRMCYNAGLAFRSRYIDRATCGATCLPITNNDTSYGIIQAGAQPGKGFHNYNTLVRSSYLDRTLLSAQSFFAGVFPADPALTTDNTSYIPTGQQPVPIYSTPDVDDWLIRAYTKCNTYQNWLAAWYQSPEFQAQAAKTEPLRTRIQQLPGFNGKTNLENWWNVFDAFNVWRDYALGDPQPFIDDTTFAQVKEVAVWLESSKMRPNLTGNLLGGPLAADLMSRMQAGAQAVAASQPIYYKLVTISSHYNAQLGLAGALGLQDYPPAASALPWFNLANPQLPQLASVMAFELHSVTPPGAAAGSAPQFVVRLVVQQGPSGPGAQYVTVPMPCAVQGDVAETTVEAGACTLDKFSQMLSSVSLGTAPAWCSACANTDATSCQLVAAKAQLQTISQPHDSDHGKELGLAIGLSVGLTFLLTALLAAAIAAIVIHRLKRTWHHQNSHLPVEEGLAKLQPTNSAALT